MTADLTITAPDPLSALDRARGCLLGLAVGDSLGTTLEFGPRRARGDYLEDVVGGGPFRLEAGQWTDDTAMALALADAVVASGGTVEPRAVLTRFTAWWQSGAFSCTGTCFDIGGTTRSGLAAFARTGSIVNNAEGDKQANGGIMRLAPVAVVARDAAEAVELSVQQSQTTHASPVCREYAAQLGQLLQRLLAGRPLPESSLVDRLRRRPRSRVRAGGHVVECYEAALWSVLHSTDFRGAVVEAANLGDDADTTAAVAGQIAGALYGASGIPTEWLDRLAWRGKITWYADALVTLRTERIQRARGDDS